MATLLLPPSQTQDQPPSLGEATFVLVLSPVRGADGHFRTQRHPIPAGQSVAASLPPVPHGYGHIIWNGAALTDEQQTKVILNPGDEVMAFPRWGPFAVPILIMVAVGIAVSVAMTALSYLLFPPKKPHIEGPEDHTSSFAGIQTAIGPGSIKPVIYGRHRFGGQLISASIDQFQTVMATAGGATRVTAMVTPPTLSMLIALGEGPIDAILTDTLELNGQPIANFPGVQLFTRLGTPDQSPIFEFNEIRNTFADGRELPDNSSNTGQQIVYTTTEPVTAFVLNIVFNQGLYHITGKGDKDDNTVTVAYQFRFSPNGPWTQWFIFDVAAQRTAPVRFGIRQEGAGLGIYDIAINFGAIRHADELKGQWQPTLESVTEIQAGAQAYPNTALLGLRTVATDQLQGTLPNVTVEVRGRTVRIGTFNPGEAWTDNPAWCVMDLLTSTRYGDGIADGDINLAAFQQWADYNDQIVDGERRHTLNYALDREGRTQSILMEIMGASRTMMLKSEGLWTPRPTRNDLPGQLLSWATCSNLRITYTRDPERVNVMEGRFANEEDGFNQDVIVWPTIENWPVEVHKASLDLKGITKPSRIMRALQFELNRRHFENMTIEFDNAIDAVTIQVHDLFRFSHPLPGWGVSGRVMDGSTTTTLYLDGYVTMQAGVTYQVYLKNIDDFTESRIVFNPGDTTTNVLQFGFPFSFQPTARDTLWAFGTASPEGAVRVFRAVKVERKSDTTVHIQAVIHNPSIYDDIVASALPVVSGLFNPLGPPPPLTFLIATEITRVQPSGASLRVVNLAWDVAGLGPGFAPYDGATVYRRSVLSTSIAGNIQAGAVDLGAIMDPSDPGYNFIQLVQVSGHVLETDDYTVVTGNTYLYRVVPVSKRGIPNVNGSMDVLISVTGSTTPDFFPGAVRNLRLRGKAVGVLTWEGRDVHIQWDTVSDSPLFSETFYVSDYIVQVWAPGQEYLMRSTNTGGVLGFTYTLAMNTEDQARNGFAGARRDLLFVVYAQSNTNRISLDPARATFTNPPPDMSSIRLETIGLFEMAIISWDQYFEPSDFDHYEVHLDIMDPPVAIYEDFSVSFHGTTFQSRKVYPQGLTIGVTYYTFVLPYDTFGAGIASHTSSFTVVPITATQIDTTPPETPTGLSLTTGTDIGQDGTVFAWVEASWDLAPEPDVARYEVHIFVGTSNAPTVLNPERNQHTIRFTVPGNTAIRVKLLASDRTANNSAFTAEATITSARDLAPPAAPTNLLAVGSIRSIALLWTPPADGDYDYSEIWVSATNNRAAASHLPGWKGFSDFILEGLGPTDTRYFWIRAVDRSGNVSPFHPLSVTAGVQGSSGQLDTTFISDLAANKITAGTINALVRIGVNQIELDGVNHFIGIRDPQSGNYRVLLGRQGLLTQTNEWGLRIFNALGQTMWNLTTGAETPGISDAAITGAKIAVGSLDAGHLSAETLFIRTAAQIEFGVIRNAHIFDLQADKLTSGHIGVQLLLGVGNNILLDGANDNIQIIDANTVLRVLMGKLGPLNSDWGLNIYDEVGNLMFSFNAGVTVFGIADLAVTNAKIQNASITNAKIGNLEVDNAKIANLTVGTGKIAPNAVTTSIIYSTAANTLIPLAAPETVIATVTFPGLAAGDQITLAGKAVLSLDVAAPLRGNAYLTLRQDSVTGSVVDQGWLRINPDQMGTLVVQGLYTQPFNTGPKAFVLTIYVDGAANWYMQLTSLIAVRFAK
jgi:predicted phage tail protein